MALKKFAAAAALTFGSVGMASTASAQPIIVTGGLVNVVVTDVIDDVTVVVQDVNVSVGAALALAANVCDVNVNVLAQQFQDGTATCENAVDDTAVVISQD